MGWRGRRIGRFWLWFLPFWAVACGLLGTCLVGLAEYIWAPLPADYPPGQEPCGEGEGLAFLFTFLPLLVVLAAVLVSPLVVAGVRRHRRLRARLWRQAGMPYPGQPWHWYRSGADDGAR